MRHALGGGAANKKKRKVILGVAVGTRTKPPSPSPQYEHNTAEASCWWLLWITLFALIIAGIILIFTYPYPESTYYREASPVRHEAPFRQNCTVGEVLDNDLELCAPVVNTPIPITASLMNHTVAVCSSFFHHQVGTWISTHENENRAFTYVYRRNQREVHDIIRSPKSGAIYKFYRSCLDTLVNGKHQALDEQQMKHVKEHILGTLHTHADLPIVFARLAAYGFTSPFTITIESHPTKSQMIPLIRFDGFVESETSLKAVEQLNAWYTDVEDDTLGTFVDYIMSERYEKNLFTMGALMDSSPPNFWKQYLRELNGYAMEEDLEMASRQVWIITPNYIRTMLSNLKSISVNDWRAFVEFSIDFNSKDFVPQLPSDSYFRKHEWKPIGAGIHVPHRMKRMKRQDFTDRTCISITHRLLPGLVGEAFLQQSMPGHMETKQRVTEVVEKVRDAYARLIEATPWMSPETKLQAVEKIRSITVRTVRPNHWEPEPFAGRLTPDMYLRNLNMIRQYRAKRNFELWTPGVPNRDFVQRFSSPLTEVNAFYSPITNTITVFPGILREPFYSDQFSDMAVYATVGMICSHELSHALDNNGRMFDADGNVRNWWTDHDVAEFNKRVECVTKEYVAPFGCVNEHYGEQTVGEDISDITGLKLAYHAYFNQHPNASLEERQQFFGVFAQMWAESYDHEHLCQLVKDDEHAIAWFRVDKTLRNTPEFWEAFGCRQGDKMVNEKPCIVYGEAPR